MRVGKRKIQALPCIIFVCIISFLFGTGMISLWQENLFFQKNILNVDFLREISNVYIDKRALFFLCLKERLGAFFIMLLMSSTIWNIAFVFSYFMLHGFAIGCVVEILIIRYGWKGVTIYLSAVLPQCILYAIGYLILGCWCMNREKTETKEKLVERKLVSIFIAFVINLLGIYIESVFSLKIFSMILNV